MSERMEATPDRRAGRGSRRDLLVGLGADLAAGMCLDDDHSGTANGNKIDLYRCNGTGAQNWLFNTCIAAGNDQYTGEIVNDINGTYNGKCLHDSNYGGVGSKVILWDCTKTSNEI